MVQDHALLLGQSPAPSPVVLRKDGLAGQAGAKSHERSHSDTPPVPVGRRKT